MLDIYYYQPCFTFLKKYNNKTIYLTYYYTSISQLNYFANLHIEVYVPNIKKQVSNK